MKRESSSTNQMSVIKKKERRRACEKERNKDQKELCHCQVLRSIDSGSVHGFPNFTKAKDGKVSECMQSTDI